MKTVLLLILLAFPLSGEVRIGARGGFFAGTANAATGTVELEARFGRWSVAPALEVIQGGYGLNATHLNVRHLFQTTSRTVWIGAGPTRVRTNESSETTWNADAGLAWRMNAWEPFVAARYYQYRLPVFRDRVEGNGAVLSIGISRKIF